MAATHCHLTKGRALSWETRSAFWKAETDARHRALRRVRERSADTLVLCGHGIALRVEAGTLLVKNGLTHYPQQQETHRYFRGDLDRPARIVVLDGSGHLTFDVLDWLAEQDVPLIRVTWTGEVVTVAGGSGYSADREKVAWQRATRDDPARRLAFSCGIIRQKIERSLATIATIAVNDAVHARAEGELSAALERLATKPPADMADLRGIEGRAAAAYFEPWQGLPLSWQTSKRRPIPEAWSTVGSRASLRAGKSKNKSATHPVNAMLNYAYAVAHGQLKIRAVREGYDPTIGIMHQSTREGPCYIHDLIEPVRPSLDRAVLSFAREQELHAADFVIRPDGACRLNPQLARRIVQLTQITEFAA